MRSLLPLRKVFCTVLLLGLLLSCLEDLGSRGQKLPDAEVEVLKQVAAKLKLGIWNFDENPCAETGGWLNITENGPISNLSCDCTYNLSTICHVKIIELKRQNLTGVLPEEFANLTYLQHLDFSLNYLSGPIPAKWASLPLIHLSIMGNRISGSIPREFGQIATLTELILNDNLLDGPIPPELGDLPNLEQFIASANNLSGPLPESLGSLKNLTYFMIDGNAISGMIPAFIGNWTRLKRLDLQGTSMVGPIPFSISLLTNLTELRISDLKGSAMEFPPLQNMRQMQKLVLRNCNISGEIPQFVGSNMQNLRTLDLSFNKLTGKIPANFEVFASISFMYLSNNMLTGDIPGWIFRGQGRLDISSNNFSGRSPVNCEQGNANLVASFSSSDNTAIAPCLRKNYPCSKKAEYYSLFINCGGRKLTINNTDYEDDSTLSGPSNFYSTERWAYSSTGDYLDNSNAQFFATNTSVLNMTYSDLYRTARLAPSSLKYYGFCLQNGNYNVKLHFAEIMFTDDQTYNSVGRRVFDVSIQGERVSKDFNIEDKAGGPGKPLVLNFTTNVTDNTLEVHFYWAGKGTTSVPYRGVYGPLISAIAVTPNFLPYLPDTNRHGLSLQAIIGITVACCAALGLLLFFLWRKGLLGRKDPKDEFRGFDLEMGHFSLKHIKVITNNFNSSNKIGEGGFGAVYKGIIPNGPVVAVKQLSSTSRQGNREFMNEISVISAVQHPNLVKLYGCCAEGNELLLIYEYMENNSLAHALFGPEEQRLKLDWKTRRKICLGIARGLAYLHEESRLKIVHRDIKATNILLDKHLIAKISDFGLAKLDEEDNTHITTRVAGTIGYMAPEYAMRGYLSDKADVYSYGVVLLEIVSGKSIMNFRPNEELVNLLELAVVLHEKGKLLELVDPNLGSHYSKEEAQRMLYLVLLCTNRSPGLRPAMSAIVSMLEGKTPVQPPLALKRDLRRKDWIFKTGGKASESTDASSGSISGPLIDSSVSVTSVDGPRTHPPAFHMDSSTGTSFD